MLSLLLLLRAEHLSLCFNFTHSQHILVVSHAGLNGPKSTGAVEADVNAILASAHIPALFICLAVVVLALAAAKATRDSSAAVDCRRVAVYYALFSKGPRLFLSEYAAFSSKTPHTPTPTFIHSCSPTILDLQKSLSVPHIQSQPIRQPLPFFFETAPSVVKKKREEMTDEIFSNLKKKKKNAH